MTHRDEYVVLSSDSDDVVECQKPTKRIRTDTAPPPAPEIAEAPAPVVAVKKARFRPSAEEVLHANTVFDAMKKVTNYEAACERAQTDLKLTRRQLIKCQRMRKKAALAPAKAKNFTKVKRPNHKYAAVYAEWNLLDQNGTVNMDVFHEKGMELLPGVKEGSIKVSFCRWMQQKNLSGRCAAEKKGLPIGWDDACALYIANFRFIRPFYAP